MRVFQLEVTQTHIDTAIAEYSNENSAMFRSISMCCPVFQAIAETGLIDEEFAIGYETVEKPRDGGGTVGIVSPNAEKITRLFNDEWRDAEPTPFTLVLFDPED